MQIGLALPTQKLHPIVRRASFKFNGPSPLNPSARIVNTAARQAVQSVASTETTRKHLSNLEKLLQKQPDLSPLDPEAVPRESTNNGSAQNRGRGLLQGLNLTRIWPEIKAAEEMSPRNLNRLQQLLTKSPEYSPRNNIGSRWREFHGCNDWSGLLEPLDENLRREVVRYGEFIQAAYHCFHSNPDTPADEGPFTKHVALPDKSYRVTKSLYATSSVGLPSWVDKLVPDLGWMTQRSSWAGYVAVCEDRKEIQRLGRRDIIIALRGTTTCLEWAENMRDLLVEIPDKEDPDPNPNGKPKVESGFLSLYQTRGTHVPSLAEAVAGEVHRLMELYKGETLSITVTGHSLGAALALLVADDLSASGPPVAVFSFGGPRVGNRGFANRMREKNVKVLRIVNSQDVITRVPGMFVSEELDEKLRKSGGPAAAKVLDALDDNMPWAYWHVGTELRVNTKMSPFLKPDADVACCHDLEAYLHLVDGFLASNCPFRPNAKRSLVRLLNEQKGNIKKLYTSKGKGLSLNLETRDDNNSSNSHLHHLPVVSPCLPSPS